MNSYFYIDKTTKQQYGPFSPVELKNHNIQLDTLVWCTGMADWAEAKTVNELAFIFDSNITPPIATPEANSTPIPPQQNQGRPLNFPQQNQNTFGNNQGAINEVRPMPKNWLIESILVTVCCCLPFGIAGIVYATKVEGLFYAGDYEAAEQASRDAKKWTSIGFFSSIGIIIVYIIVIAIAAIVGSL